MEAVWYLREATSLTSTNTTFSFSHWKDWKAVTVPTAGCCNGNRLFQAILHKVRLSSGNFSNHDHHHLEHHHRKLTSTAAESPLLLTIRNSIRSTDPSLVAATCIYLACKIEECPQHIKHIITEMKHALASMEGLTCFDAFLHANILL